MGSLTGLFFKLQGALCPAGRSASFTFGLPAVSAGVSGAASQRHC